MVLADRYRLDSCLAGAGVGVDTRTCNDVRSFRATQLALGREVAVKILEADADAETEGRFLREARAHGLLASEHTVRVLDFGVGERGERFLVTELLDGESLRDRLARLGRLPADVAIDVALQVLRALAEAHRKGVVHRDLKPEHIRFVRVADAADREIVKVEDFGIAKHLERGAINVVDTRQGVVVGTPHYMSPEQARGEAVHASGDLYAVGVVLYEMLTGATPFDAETPVLVMARHLDDAPAPPSAACPQAAITPALDAFVARVLAKDPASRPASADTMAEELACVRNATLAPAAPRAADVATVRTRRRGRSARYAIAAAAAFVVALVVAGLTKSWAASEEAPLAANEAATLSPGPAAPSPVEPAPIAEATPDAIPVSALPVPVGALPEASRAAKLARGRSHPRARGSR
jgi:serine/threonine-protein kinase